MEENIFGRDTEKKYFKQILSSKKAEFIAVCGRRRVGKTFLIKEYFENQIVFKTSGIANTSKTTKIKTFYKELLVSGLNKIEHKKPEDWTDIFFLLRTFIESIKSKRKVIFLDELPWMDSSKGDFVPALEYFWNSWCSTQKDIILIVCGSSTSWMMDKIINNHGGLHNRLTGQLFIQPFNLNECEIMLKHKGFSASKYDIAIMYMVFGGIPYYIDMLNNQLSIAQNIDYLCFNKNGGLLTEFENLYAALFKNSDKYIQIVKALSKKNIGLTRQEIEKESQISSGGGLSTMLNNLKNCGFVRIYQNFDGERGQKELYQLIDFYTLFYFNFIEGKKIKSWLKTIEKPIFNIWCGITFELLILQHTQQIKKCLGISGIESNEYAWRSQEKDQGAQIDLVIERADNTINLIEAKFYNQEFTITSEYEKNLLKKKEIFSSKISPKKSIQITMLTSFGIKQGSHSSIVNNEITLEDLFK